MSPLVGVGCFWGGFVLCFLFWGCFVVVFGWVWVLFCCCLATGLLGWCWGCSGFLGVVGVGGGGCVVV